MADLLSPQQQLDQYLTKLQSTPEDLTLRENIIKHVQTMSPAPSIPEEARRYFIEGNVLLKAAKDKQGYLLANEAYRKCLLSAPWWSEALYNYSISLELNSQFDQAIETLKLYIATNPAQEDARKAQDKVYEIGAKKQIAMMESGTSSSDNKKLTDEELIRSLDGAEYYGNYGTWEAKFRIDGSKLIWWSRLSRKYSNDPFAPPDVLQLVGRTARYTGTNKVPFEFTISEDEKVLTQTTRDPTGGRYPYWNSTIMFYRGK